MEAGYTRISPIPPEKDALLLEVIVAEPQQLDPSQPNFSTVTEAYRITLYYPPQSSLEARGLSGGWVAKAELIDGVLRATEPEHFTQRVPYTLITESGWLSRRHDHSYQRIDSNTLEQVRYL